MVAAVIFAGALDNLDVLGLFHHADGGSIALRIDANAADFLAGNIAADAAERHPITHCSQRLLEAVNLLWVLMQHVEGDALR